MSGSKLSEDLIININKTLIFFKFLISYIYNFISIKLVKKKAIKISKKNAK